MFFVNLYFQAIVAGFLALFIVQNVLLHCCLYFKTEHCLPPLKKVRESKNFSKFWVVRRRLN